MIVISIWFVVGESDPDNDSGKKSLISVVEVILEDNSLRSHKGVYMDNTVPSYETPDEVRMTRRMGSDAVGMSTVSECIVANQDGMKIDGISTIISQAAGVTVS